ncbi:hypothetical protein ACQPW1_19545 [Nocardia sp. CA-128927]|uniref:hypothetical protein n=1 Tax=Nocardia sp. CA-128927 TaxID=3239975 RepID=UPI003D9651E6
MSETGAVREWHAEEGWGVIDAAAVPALKSERRDLVAGEQVEFEWELAEQDGFQFRALRLWLAGASPVEPSIRHDAGGVTMAEWDIDPDTLRRH